MRLNFYSDSSIILILGRAIPSASRFRITISGWLTVGLIALAGMWVDSLSKIHAYDSRQASFGLTPQVQVYEIRQASMGLAPRDGITVIIDTLEGEYSADLENKVVHCIRDAFNGSDMSTVRVVYPGDFRRVEFPGLTPKQVLSESWNKRLNEIAFRERITSLGLRYLIAVTVSEGRTHADSVGSGGYYWEWQRFAVIRGKVVDLTDARVTGMVTSSVRKTSSFGILPIPHVNPSFIEGRACREFGRALIKFLAGEEQPPRVIMSSLTLKNLFPQRRDDSDRDQDIYMADDGNPAIRLNSVASDKALMTDPRIPKSLLLSHKDTTQFVEQMGTSVPDKSEIKESHDVAAKSRWEEIRPLIKGRKKLVVHEDKNARWLTTPAGLENASCHEIKLSLNILTLNTGRLPPLPSRSRWKLIPSLSLLYIAKLAFLPMQLAIPVVPILAAPLYPIGAVWGLGTLYNCLPELRDNKETDQHTYLPIGSDSGIYSMTPTAFTPTFDLSSISLPDDRRGKEIHYAAANGDADRVRLLIKNNKDSVRNKNKAGLTPLHMAASNGQYDMVKLLLANKADVNPRDWQGATPLQLAETHGHKDIVNLLLKHGAKD